MKDFELIEWDKEQIILAITSTYGDGEPPEPAVAYFEWLKNTDLSLAHIQYSVLALGDDNYPKFCEAGKTLNERFVQVFYVINIL